MSPVRLSLVGLATFFVCTAALAQGTPQQRAACRPDVGKFCKGKGEDPGVLLQCLEDNKDKISERCRKVIAAADDKPAEKKDEKPAENAEKKDETPVAVEKK